NGLNGVDVSGNSNSVVGDLSSSTIGMQVISGNGASGVRITGTNNSLAGSRIGTDVTGEAALANALDGVFLGLGADFNSIGNFAVGAGNLISGNQSNGLEILSNSNYIVNDIIGLDLGGNTALGNSLDGVLLRGNLNSMLSS